MPKQKKVKPTTDRLKKFQGSKQARLAGTYSGASKEQAGSYFSVHDDEDEDLPYGASRAPRGSVLKKAPPRP
eukprot:gene11952-2182_t